MNFEQRDPRFDELDRLIELGLGDVQQNGKLQQRIECARCRTKLVKRANLIDSSEAQYCPACAGRAKRELNLIRGGRPRKREYESAEVRRRIYLQETGRTGTNR